MFEKWWQLDYLIEVIQEYNIWYILNHKFEVDDWFQQSIDQKFGDDGKEVIIIVVY